MKRVCLNEHTEFLRIKMALMHMRCLQCSSVVRRAYGKISGVESVDTHLDGATVKLRGGNSAAVERFWTIANRLGTEPTEADVEVVGKVSLTLRDGFGSKMGVEQFLDPYPTHLPPDFSRHRRLGRTGPSPSKKDFRQR